MLKKSVLIARWAFAPAPLTTFTRTSSEPVSRTVCAIACRHSSAVRSAVGANITRLSRRARGARRSCVLLGVNRVATCRCAVLDKSEAMWAAREGSSAATKMHFRARRRGLPTVALRLLSREGERCWRGVRNFMAASMPTAVPRENRTGCGSAVGVKRPEARGVVPGSGRESPDTCKWFVVGVKSGRP